MPNNAQRPSIGRSTHSTMWLSVTRWGLRVKSATSSHATPAEKIRSHPESPTTWLWVSR